MRSPLILPATHGWRRAVRAAIGIPTKIGIAQRLHRGCAVWSSPLPVTLLLGDLHRLLGQRVTLVADRPQLRGECAHRDRLSSAAIAASVSAASRTNCETIDPAVWRFSNQVHSLAGEPIVVRVMGTAKSWRRASQGAALAPMLSLKTARMLSVRRQGERLPPEHWPNTWLVRPADSTACGCDACCVGLPGPASAPGRTPGLRSARN